MAAASITSLCTNSARLPAPAPASVLHLPAAWTANSGSTRTWGRDVAAVLGIVSASQIAYTRSGPNLTLNPPLTPAFDQSTIPYYNVYFSDTWHMKPTFTLTYGLGWTLEMPPVEKDGKQVEFVDQSDQPIDVQGYMAARKRAALLGQVFNPRRRICLGRQYRQRLEISL